MLDLVMRSGSITPTVQIVQPDAQPFRGRLSTAREAMNTRRWLLLIFVTGALFTSTWYFFERERPPQIPVPPTPPPKQRSPRELLVGIWELVESDGQKLPEHLELTVEFTPDGKHIVREN